MKTWGRDARKNKGRATRRNKKEEWENKNSRKRRGRERERWLVGVVDRGLPRFVSGSSSIYLLALALTPPLPSPFLLPPPSRAAAFSFTRGHAPSPPAPPSRRPAASAAQRKRRGRPVRSPVLSAVRCSFRSIGFI